MLRFGLRRESVNSLQFALPEGRNKMCRSASSESTSPTRPLYSVAAASTATLRKLAIRSRRMACIQHIRFFCSGGQCYILFSPSAVLVLYLCLFILFLQPCIAQCTAARLGRHSRPLPHRLYAVRLTSTVRRAYVATAVATVAIFIDGKYDGDELLIMEKRGECVWGMQENRGR